MQQKNLILLVLTFFCIRLTGLHAQAVKDIDGNVYPVITIGKQAWMAENLKTTKYNDGSPIPLITEDKAWKALKTPGYCWFDNNIENKDVYGALYNWYTVDTKKLCPRGWHVPSASEWRIMISFLGDINTAGDKLKESGSAHWKNSLSIVTNDFEFTALPGGFRLYTGGFPDYWNSYAVWWSSTMCDEIQSWNWGLYFSSSRVFRGCDTKQAGLSVRCIEDH